MKTFLSVVICAIFREKVTRTKLVVTRDVSIPSEIVDGDCRKELAYLSQVQEGNS